MMLDAEELQEDFLQCDICLFPFDDAKCTPRVLKCLHVYCEGCLEQMAAQGTVACPSCRQITILPLSGIQGFPKDNTRRSLRDFIKVKKKPGEILCNDCPDNEKAGFFCKECGIFMCTDCNDVHKNPRNKFSKGHTVKSIRELQTAGIDTFQHQPKCGEHDQHLTFYCSKEGCEELICTACTICKHDKNDGHIIQQVSDIFPEKKQSLMEAVAALKQQGDHIQKAIDATYAAEDRIYCEEQKFDSEVEEFLRTCQDYYHIKFFEMREAVVKRREALQQLERKQSNACKFAKNILSVESPAAVLQLTERVKNQVEELSSNSFSEEARESIQFIYGAQLPVDIMQEVLEAQCRIEQYLVTTFTASLNKHSMVARVEITDDANKKVKINLSDLKAFITDRRGRGHQGIICHSETDQYTIYIFFTPTRCSRYTLGLELNGETLMSEGCGFNVVYSTTKYKSPAPPPPVEGQGEPAAKRPRTSFGSQGPCFVMCADTVYRWLHLSDDRRTLTSSVTSVNRGQGQLIHYQGGCGTMGFDANTTGRVCYQVHVQARLQSELEERECLFEVGLTRKGEMDTSSFLAGNPYSCSFTIEGCHEHEGLCWFVTISDTLKAHNRLADNGGETELDENYGFVLDIDKKTWTVLDCVRGTIVATVENINLDEPMWPVFSINSDKETVDPISLRLTTGVKF